MRQLTTDLVNEIGLSLGDFDVLAQLGRAGGALRISELAAQAFSSRSGMTRRVDRLVAEGLVSRANSDADGRGVVIALTDAGVARLAEAAPVHLRQVHELFVAKLNDQELATEEIHPHARAAAGAAEAADAQGAFWAMHEHLFEHQKALEDHDLHQYAVDLGLEPEHFERDRTSPDVARRIERDQASGDRSGVQGTPTFYVNNARHDGPYDVDSLRSAITAQFRRTSKGR